MNEIREARLTLIAHVFACPDCAVPVTEPRPAIGWPLKMTPMSWWKLCPRAEVLAKGALIRGGDGDVVTQLADLA